MIAQIPADPATIIDLASKVGIGGGLAVFAYFWSRVQMRRIEHEKDIKKYLTNGNGSIVQVKPSPELIEVLKDVSKAVGAGVNHLDAIQGHAQAIRDTTTAIKAKVK